MLRSVAMMMAVSVASAFPGSSHGFQALVQTAQSRDQSDSSSTNVTLGNSDAYNVKYDDTCMLAYAYMPSLGNAAGSRPCVGIQLFDSPPDCDGLEDPTLPCIAFAVSGVTSQSKDTKIETQEERSELIDLSMKIEGSGYGVTASASTNVAISSESSSSSVMFTAFMGATDILTVRIRNHQKMQLKPQYAKQLEAEPGTFFDQYGHFFIHSIVYGASFTGMISFVESQSATSSSTKTEISVDYNSMAKADASLETQTKKMSKRMNVESSTTAHGGQLTPMSGLSLKEILDVRSKWWDDVKERCTQHQDQSAHQVMRSCTAKEQKMGFTHLTAIDHVQEIIRKAGKDPFEFSKVAIPSAYVRNRLAKEFVECDLFLRTLDNYKMDNTIQRLRDQGFSVKDDFVNSIASLSQEFKSHKQTLGNLTLDTAPDFSSFPCSAGDYTFKLEQILASSGLPPKLQECPPDDGAYACCNARTLEDGEPKWPCLANSGNVDFGDYRATNCNVDFKPGNSKRNQPCKINFDECPDENHCKIDALRACKDISADECQLGLPGCSEGRPSSCKRPCKVSLAGVQAYKRCMDGASGAEGARCKDKHMDMCEVFSTPPIDCGCGGRRMNPYGQNCYCNYYSADCQSGFSCKDDYGNNAYDENLQFRKCRP